jgi:ABC-type Na+ transport system ATPase subunit NatA
MIRRLDVQNFTVFREASFEFGQGLNVIGGENGAGNTHLLKLVYSLLAASWEVGRRPNVTAPTRALLQPRVAEKLVGVFRPEALGAAGAAASGAGALRREAALR